MQDSTNTGPAPKVITEGSLFYLDPFQRQDYTRLARTGQRVACSVIGHDTSEFVDEVDSAIELLDLTLGDWEPAESEHAAARSAWLALQAGPRYPERAAAYQRMAAAAATKGKEA